ncbi:RDD family protein [Streptomyces sp. NBC_01754]|uniref:RDD family protein n=1 Tax=Streptomyces sp. NBC_01754 TaxID=2975930 RepID=UPI002DD8701F|nr:RDD family protein [Streptomyces sp. NBC_01754]WSC92707.1 RDD family protein [Streptomyces sp. NBC_01754]
MSAPTPAPGDESPSEGYYPDPSIPGYVRYWNGASWVPGTSRPAPSRDGVSSAPPPVTTVPQSAEPSPAPVDETGPIYFDEVEAADESGPDGGRPEPSTAWQADTSRQTGFGGEHDHRVSWGGGPDPRTAAPAPSPDAAAASDTAGPPAAVGGAGAGRTSGDASPGATAPVASAPGATAPVDPRRPAVSGPARGRPPGMRDGDGGVTDGTVTLRADRPGGADDAGPRPPTDGTVTIRPVRPDRARPPHPRGEGAAPTEGTITMRALPGTRAPQAQQPPARQAHQTSVPQAHQPSVPQAPQGPARRPAAPQSSQPPRAPSLARTPPQAQAPSPVPAPQPVPPQHPGPADGSASWAQQVHQLARPEQTAGPGQPAPAPARQQPVTPWKPPVDDPFQQLARAQASARPAGLGRRLAARVLDTVVLGALVGAAGFPLATRALDHVDRKIDAAKQTGETVTVWLLDSTTAGLLGAVIAAFLVLGLLLEALPTAKWGRTLGKRLCGVEVRDIESHGTPTFRAALYRWLVYGVLGLLVVGVVNVLWCLVDRPWRQCWHDKAARTFVAG